MAGTDAAPDSAAPAPRLSLQAVAPPAGGAGTEAATDGRPALGSPSKQAVSDTALQPADESKATAVAAAAAGDYFYDESGSEGSDMGILVATTTVTEVDVDAEESDFSDGGGSEASVDDEDVQAEPPPEVSVLAEVDEPAPPASSVDLPPPLSLAASSYPDHNLPPHTGISTPMLLDPPNFIRATPPVPEPLYVAPDSLFDDIVKQEADRVSNPDLVRNLTVFDSVDAPAVQEHNNTSNIVGDVFGAHVSKEHATDLPFYYRPCGPEDTTLVFESRFESGNLRRAVKVYDYEYDLILNPDYNTKSHTQWYLFRVGNTRRGPTYRFNIINMVKPTSVYNDGMRPLQYSTISATINGIGWVRCGDRIAYYQNGIRKKGGTNYYTLTFTVTFEHDCDQVYFSHCFPYTYTDLQNDLRELEKDPNMARRFRRRKLCETLAGNACDLITITSFCSDAAALRARRAVVITARVHPGESNASWVMKGMLDYLTGPSLDARILRDNFVFKIVPMLNPDGVIVGNYRCSLAGQDLNRLWDDPSRKMHPTIFFTKSMIRHLINDRDVLLYIDIHGHSRKKNVFMYGNSEGTSMREKIFPGLLCKNSDCFCFDDCCFKVQKAKESTARVVAYRELTILNAFTLEASFCGADFGPLADLHFNQHHLEEMGYMICDAILDFCDPDQHKVMQVVRELQQLYPDDGNSDDVSDSEDDGAAAARARRRKAAGSGRRAKQREKASGSKKKRTGEKAERGADGEAAAARDDGAASSGSKQAAGGEADRSSGAGGGAARRATSADAAGAAGRGREREPGSSSSQKRSSRKKKRKDKARGDGEVAPQDPQGSDCDGGGAASSGAAASAPGDRPLPPLDKSRPKRPDGKGAT